MKRLAVFLALASAIAGAFLLGQFVQRKKEEASPQGQYRAGAGELYRGRYRAAVKRLTEVIRLQPRNAKAYYFRGLALRELRALPAAVEDLTRALQLDPALAGAGYQRALARESLGDTLGALSDIDSLLAADPKRVELRAMRARLLESIGRDSEAEEELDRLLKERPKSYFPLVSRAALRRGRSDLKGALADCDAAIALDDRVASAFVEKASVYEAFPGRERYREAIEAYAKTIELLPARADFYSSRGDVRMGLYQYQDALADMTAAIGIQPQLASYWVGRGHLYRDRTINEEQQSSAAALKDLTKAIELSPKTISGYFYRASVKSYEGQFDDAILDAKAILQLDEKSAGAYVLLCQIYDSKKEHEKALSYCDRAIDLEPYYASARTTRVSVLIALRRSREAIEEATRAIDIEPWWDTTWSVRASAYLLAGMRDKAAADCRRGIELNPNNVRLKRQLQDALSAGNF
ncbi:MAG: tetratricopeptide repeat protein [Elusimicrobia bacterium]|nr:tetratricopeptide repeat protein [Elusimicrobiota bacterium]